MFTITWTFGSFINKVSFEDREEANECWKILKEVGATNMGHETSTKRKVVKVVFPGGNKKYTYLTKEKVPVGSLVVVWTDDGRQIVTVVDSGEMTDSELAKICPLSKFKYIEGKVVAA